MINGIIDTMYKQSDIIRKIKLFGGYIQRDFYHSEEHYKKYHNSNIPATAVEEASYMLELIFDEINNIEEVNKSLVKKLQNIQKELRDEDD